MTQKIKKTFGWALVYGVTAARVGYHYGGRIDRRLTVPGAIVGAYHGALYGALYGLVVGGVVE